MTANQSSATTSSNSHSSHGRSSSLRIKPLATASSGQDHPDSSSAVSQEFSQNCLDELTNRIALRPEAQQLLQDTALDIHQWLKVERVLLLQWSDRSLSSQPHALIVEAPSGAISSIREQQWDDQNGISPWAGTESDRHAYIQGRIDVAADITRTTLLLPQRLWLDASNVRAFVHCPIVIDQTFWGMLMIQQCSGCRTWHQTEIDLLQRIAKQLAIGIANAELRQQVRQLNQSQPSMQLQAQLSRTESMAPLKQSLKFAELVLGITERIRDSLDEAQILQTATDELAKALSVERCKIELYDSLVQTATVAYEHALVPPNCIGMTRTIADFPELYEPLCQHQPVQFVVPPSSNLRLVNMTRLACPIFDDQGLLGNLWLFRPRNELFNRWELRIIQQIANECAIAIRQARLYEAAQKQVRELERLNQLKDDFLKTISHELRTPLSSIILGVQTLERVWGQTDGTLPKDEKTIQRLFQTVHMECHRENKLIEDLLTFCYLEAGKEASVATSIDLNRWLIDIVKPFELRIQNQNQQLSIELSEALPPLKTELAYLERIVSELLNNACKYTPSQEKIILSTRLTTIQSGGSSSAPSDYIMLQVKNSGVEIPEEEQERIFDKFYRIPSSDPWQYGGTGLGLALVKKLTQCLGASISVTSEKGQTSFTLLFPTGK